MKKNILPADVPQLAQKQYAKNLEALTKNTNNLFLFACDQKIEHLAHDFYGSSIAPEALTPDHIFAIADASPIGALATHPGLIARYAANYTDINYIAKLNGKTNLVPQEEHDPLSEQLWQVDDLTTLIDNGIPICGVGYTLYLGSYYESTMLQQAAQIIHEAHQRGLVALLWVYPRGAALSNSNDPMLTAGATGVAVSLGADFVKVQAPLDSSLLRLALDTAGNTGVICAGGTQKEIPQLLETIYQQLQAGTAGAAIGRNIFQRTEKEACALATALAALIYEGVDSKQAYTIYQDAC